MAGGVFAGVGEGFLRDAVECLFMGRGEAARWTGEGERGGEVAVVYQFFQALGERCVVRGLAAGDGIAEFAEGGADLLSGFLEGVSRVRGSGGWEQCEAGFEEDVGGGEVVGDAVVDFTGEAVALLGGGEGLGLRGLSAELLVGVVELAAGGEFAADGVGAAGGEKERRAKADEVILSVTRRDQQSGESREKEIRQEDRGHPLRREVHDHLREYREEKCPNEIRRGLRAVEHHREGEELVKEVASVSPGPVVGGGAVAHEPEVYDCRHKEEGEVERSGFPESDRDVINREDPEHAERSHHPAIVRRIGKRFGGNIAGHTGRLAVSRCGRQ